MQHVEGTGVRRYAQALVHALTLLSVPPWRLTDTYVTKAWGEQGRVEKARRSLEARTGRPVRAMAMPGGTLHGRDIFRRGQVHFRQHGTLLDVVVDEVAPGIMHWTCPVPIRLKGWINLYTVHDAIPLAHPELTMMDPARHRRLLTAIGRSAAAVLTVSGQARREIIDSGTIPADRLFDTGIALCPPNAAADLPAGLMSGNFLLAIGAAEPRKNAQRLVAAWRASATPLPLVVIGPRATDPDIVAALMTPGVIVLGYQPDQVVSALLCHARALLFPSLAEGFGLPIVEAMAAGTPVLTSGGGATEETAGGAALLVDPCDVAAMAVAITRIDTDPALRGELAARGRRRAGDFASDQFAQRLAAVHRRVVATAMANPT